MPAWGTPSHSPCQPSQGEHFPLDDLIAMNFLVCSFYQPSAHNETRSFQKKVHLNSRGMQQINLSSISIVIKFGSD